MVQVNENVVKIKMAFLYDHIIIASFVGIRPSPMAYNSWLGNLNKKIGGGKMLFDYSLQKRLFMIKIEGLNTVKKLLMFTPFKIN